MKQMYQVVVASLCMTGLLVSGVSCLSTNAPGSSVAPRMATGIKIGEMTKNSAIVWTRLTRTADANWGGTAWPVHSWNKMRDPEVQLPEGKVINDMFGTSQGVAGEVKVVYWTKEQKEAGARETGWVSVDTDRDSTAQVKLEKLTPGTEYFIKVLSRGAAGQPGARMSGSFVTVPDEEEVSPVLFTVITGQDYKRRDDEVNGHKIFPHMLALHPDFFVHTGDIVYYDGNQPWGCSEALARVKWNITYALPYQFEFHKNVGSYFIKDDHDTLKNDCWPGQNYGELTWEQGLSLFREQVPMGKSTYRTVRWGKDLQVWMVEGRDFRSNNPDPDGPDKTLWGKEQKEWFYQTVKESDAAFRILISPTPLIGPDKPNKRDNHVSPLWKHEGDELKAFMVEQKNMVIVCGDRHWQYVSVDRDSGLREYSCGATSDVHVDKFERSPMHDFFMRKGGFMSCQVDRAGGVPQLTFSFHGVDGDLFYSEALTFDAAAQKLVREVRVEEKQIEEEK